MDFKVSNTLKFSPKFISIHPPLDFTIKYQFWGFLALQNVGSCKVAILGFLLTVGHVQWMETETTIFHNGMGMVNRDHTLPKTYGSTPHPLTTPWWIHMAPSH